MKKLMLLAIMLVGCSPMANQTPVVFGPAPTASAYATMDPSDPGAVAARSVELQQQAAAIATQQADNARQVAQLTAAAGATESAYNLSRQQTVDALAVAQQSNIATATARALVLAAQADADNATSTAVRATATASAEAGFATATAWASATAQQRAVIAEQDARIAEENHQASERIWSIAGPLLVIAAIGLLLFFAWYGGMFFINHQAEQRRAEANHRRELEKIQRAQEMLRETSAGVVVAYMGADGMPHVEVLPRAAIVDAQARTARTEVPVLPPIHKRDATGERDLPRSNDPDQERARVVVLRFLDRCIDLAGEDSTKVPGADELGMNDRAWGEARTALGDALRTQRGGGEGRGTWVNHPTFTTLGRLEYGVQIGAVILQPLPSRKTEYSHAD